MQIFGDPETMARMTRQFMNAASYGTATDGLMSSLPPKAQELLMEFGTNLARQLGDGHSNGKSEGNGAAKPIEAAATPPIETPIVVKNEPVIPPMQRELPPRKPAQKG